MSHFGTMNWIKIESIAIYSTVADIHTMMAVPTTRGRQMGAQRRFLLQSRWPARVGGHVLCDREPVVHSIAPRSNFGPRGLQLDCWILVSHFDCIALGSGAAKPNRQCGSVQCPADCGLAAVATPVAPWTGDLAAKPSAIMRRRNAVISNAATNANIRMVFIACT